MQRVILVFISTALTFTLRAQPGPSVYEALEKNYFQGAFEACVAMEKDVESFTRNRLDTLASNSFFYIGDAFNQLGDTRKALFYFEHEKKILQSLQMTYTPDYSNSLNNLAYLYLLDGNYTSAGATADELLVNDRKIFLPTADEFVSSVLYVADIYIQLDRFRDAEKLLQATLKPQGDGNANRGLLLNKLGDLYSYTGEYSRASKALLEALDVHLEHSGEESPEYITAAISLGVLYMNQGKYPEAEEIFEVALSKVDPSDPVFATLLNNQALVLQSLGQLNAAEKTLIEIKRSDSLSVGTSHPDFAITLSNLGLVYADLEKFASAERALNRALQIQKENNEGNTLSYARKLNNLAKVHQLAGSAAKAVPLFREALSIFRKTMSRESPEYATAAYNLGVAYWKAGKGTTGYKYLKASASIRAKVLGKNHPKYAESILKMGEYQWEKKSFDEAAQSFGKVFENYYFQIDQTFPVLTEEEKSKFYYTNFRDSFDKFNSFAVGQKDADPSLISDVYDYLINTKAVIMFATEKVKSTIRESGNLDLIEKFELWQTKKEQIARLYSLNQAHTKLDSLLQEANALEKALTRESASFAGHLIRKKYSWKEIRSALRPGEAAVEVLRFKVYNPAAGGQFPGKVHYAFLVVTSETKEQPDLILLEDGNELETKYLKSYRNNIKFQLPDTYSYRMYFEPLAHYLRKANIQRFFFSPDGVYNQISINGIENPESRKFLVDEYDVRLVTNTRELAESKPEGKRGQSSILIGYPKYNLEGAELRERNRERVTRGGNLSRTWRGGLLRYMRGEEGITVLPGTEAEVHRIAQLFGASGAVFTEAQASERITKSVSNPTVLHIATHGYFLEDVVTDQKSGTAYVSNPLLNAGLILAGAENFLKSGEPINDEGDDGILTAFEAMNLNLDHTDLVVLSACETGLGDVKNGEGVYGLQRAFKLAGARSIVMSLWNVDDEATQLLMTSFYEEMLHTGNQQEAFRTAQQAVKEKYPAPFYWAAFIMVGM